uniref:Mediator of RNA polymerase II transcription subunit 16 n=1 Tax=Timema bartmani TaxID=61472 RepID=A0A7R9EV94_9NEOP|nr:unnamed protein product [Timema bartmani]
MDLVYSVLRKTTNFISKSTQGLLEGHTLCSVSSQNVVAFTSITELEDISGKTWGSHVYIADLNSPWNTHKIASKRAAVTVLEWDLPGEKLLLADASGNVQIWTFKDHVLNDWQCLGTTTFAGEHILAGAFFHNGRKIKSLIIFVPPKLLVHNAIYTFFILHLGKREREKNDALRLHVHTSGSAWCRRRKTTSCTNEKFSHLRFAPSVRHFGNRPTVGCIVISTTSMIGVVVLSIEGLGPAQLITTSDSLATTRQRVSASPGEDKCIIMSQALPSFFLQSNLIKENQCRHLVQLKFVVREDADSLVVAANGDSGCLVEIWELREKPLPIHKLFQPKPHVSQLEMKTVLWQHQSHFIAQSPVVCVTTSKISITTTMPPPCYVMVALADGTIHGLYRDALKQISSTSLNLSWRQEEPPAVKQHKLSPRISHLDMSWLGSVLLAIDTQGQLYLYRLLPVAEPVCVVGGPLTVPYACTLLEYCLVTGLDCWDLLVSLRPSMMDSVSERFIDSFNRQLPAVQQFYYIQFLSIRTLLYRLTINNQSRANDLTSLMMLHSVATAFKSLLRPSDMSSHDKGPAESLAAVMSESPTDVDKVLFHLEAKEFTVEPSTLQSLQQLIQWVADLALNLLSRLPEQRQAGKSSAYDLLRDYKAINTLRELLVIIRIWGLLRQSCLPVFVRSAENLDVFALLFKLLSRLVQTPEPDENLLERIAPLTLRKRETHRISVVSKEHSKESSFNDQPNYTTKTSFVQPKDAPVSYKAVQILKGLHSDSDKDLSVSMQSISIQPGERTGKSTFEIDFDKDTPSTENSSSASIPTVILNNQYKGSKEVGVELARKVPKENAKKISITESESSVDAQPINVTNRVNTFSSPPIETVTSQAALPNIKTKPQVILREKPVLSVDVSRQTSNVYDPDQPKSPREIFFSDLIRQAEGKERELKEQGFDINRRSYCLDNAASKRAKDNRKSVPFFMYHDTQKITEISSESPVDNSFAKQENAPGVLDTKMSIMREDSKLRIVAESPKIPTSPTRVVAGKIPSTRENRNSQGEYFIANVERTKSETSELHLFIGQTNETLEPKPYEWKFLSEDNIVAGGIDKNINNSKVLEARQSEEFIRNEQYIQMSHKPSNDANECCLLPSQVMIPQLDPPTKTVCVASPALFCHQSLPIQLEFGVEPDSLQFSPDQNLVEGAMQTDQVWLQISGEQYDPDSSYPGVGPALGSDVSLWGPLEDKYVLVKLFPIPPIQEDSKTKTIHVISSCTKDKRLSVNSCDFDHFKVSDLKKLDEE